MIYYSYAAIDNVVCLEAGFNCVQMNNKLDAGVRIYRSKSLIYFAPLVTDLLKTHSRGLRQYPGSFAYSLSGDSDYNGVCRGSAIMLKCIMRRVHDKFLLQYF